MKQDMGPISVKSPTCKQKEKIEYIIKNYSRLQEFMYDIHVNKESMSQCYLLFPQTSSCTTVEQGAHSLRKLDSYFVNLCDNSIHHFSFERTKYNCFVFDRVQHKTSARLNHTSTDIINCSYCNDKTIPAKQETYQINIGGYYLFIKISTFQQNLLSRTRPLHLCEKLLFDRVQKVRSEVPWMEENLMLQRDLLIKHNEHAWISQFPFIQKLHT